MNMMNYQFRRSCLKRSMGERVQRGFSLIELMVGVAIVSIVLFLGVPVFSTWLQSSQIRNAAESIVSGLEIAKAEAVRRNANVQFQLTSLAGGGVASDWAVSCVAASPDPTIVCPNAGLAAPNDVIQRRNSAEGSRNVQLAAAGVANTIVFNGIGRITPTPAPAVAPNFAPIQITVSNPAGGTCVTAGGGMRCLNILVNGGGQVRMCDPAVALAVNPRGCG
jgi:type IV fimbrial biogenesis protein FimT